MFDGYHFGSLKFYDEMMITFGMEGVGLSYELKNWAKSSDLYGISCSRFVWNEMRCEMRCDMRCEMRCDRPPITSRVCGELYLKSSIHVWTETFASVVGRI